MYDVFREVFGEFRWLGHFVSKSMHIIQDEYSLKSYTFSMKGVGNAYNFLGVPLGFVS